MKKIFLWKKIFACPSCGEKITVSVWKTIPSKISDPEKYVCLSCKETTMLPRGWIVASAITAITAFFAMAFGIGIIPVVFDTFFPTSEITVWFTLLLRALLMFLLVAFVGLAAIWLGGIVALMAPHLIVYKRYT